METFENKSGNSSTSITIPCKPDYSFLEKTYRKNEIIVSFEEVPTKEQIEIVKGYFHKMGIKDIKINTCDNCELPVQLWQAENIHTIISGKTIKAGSGPGTGTVGEHYSLNFLSEIPYHNWDKSAKQTYKAEKSTLKEVVTIAVLDTGIDPFIVDQGYIAHDLQNQPGNECFAEVQNGWNFVDNNADIEDDNPGRHGSLVTQFIINEFKKSEDRTVRIIPLKTHDRNGEGDLFKIFCAAFYAIAKGAQIINASWGFYYYESLPYEPLKILIDVLHNKGILLVTAAGNQDKSDDRIAEEIYRIKHHGGHLNAFQLRDLAIHQFLPACLSNTEANLITVTTTDGVNVAPTENHSNAFVDIGVIADKNQNEDLWFNVPFEQSSAGAVVRGSSFATAIATGIIGANCGSELYTANTINKQLFIAKLFEITRNIAGSDLCTKHAGLSQRLIKNGVCIQK